MNLTDAETCLIAVLAGMAMIAVLIFNWRSLQLGSPMSERYETAISRFKIAPPGLERRAAFVFGVLYVAFGGALQVLIAAIGVIGAMASAACGVDIFQIFKEWIRVIGEWGSSLISNLTANQSSTSLPAEEGIVEPLVK